MPEGIVDQEDRTLDSSLGNWTGDASWEAGPIEGRSGLMDFACEPFGEDLIQTLSAPAVTIPEDLTVRFSFLSKVIPGEPPGPYGTIQLSDGIHVLEPAASGGETIEGWQYAWYDFDTPPDWNPETAQIIITIHNPYDESDHAYIDSFSLAYEEPPPTERIDYLPLLGVG